MSRRVSTVRRLVDYPPPTPQSTPCRLWQGPVIKDGYGVRPGMVLVHRWVWEQINGPIPPGMRVLHRCDNPPCYRYDHLFLGTAADNTADMVTKGRHRGQHPGELHPLSKLTERDVLDILARPDERPSALAREYSVHPATITKIRRGRLWRSLQERNHQTNGKGDNESEAD